MTLTPGSGVSILGSGDFGTSSTEGRLTCVVDASSDTPANRSYFGTLSFERGVRNLNEFLLPPGAHSIEMETTGPSLNFTFEGFSMITNLTG